MLIINLPSDGLSKKDIFTAMVKAAEQASFEAQLMADNEEAIVEALMNREKMGDTCVAPGIAMAHARIEALQRVFLMGAILSDSREWGGQNQVELVFMNYKVFFLNENRIDLWRLENMGMSFQSFLMQWPK